VSKLSTEVEYRLMTMTTCELKWLKWILSILGTIHTTMLLHCDSETALQISHYLIFHV